MSFTLPREINYSSLPSLPSGSTSMSNSLLPVNGSVFPLAAGSLIQFDLPSVGYAQGDSFYLKYDYRVVGGGGASCLLSTPSTSPYARYELLIGSQVAESINGYNVVSNMLTNSSMGVSEKYGSSLGYRNDAAETKPGNEYFDGRVMNENSVGTLSFPFKHNLLANAAKLIPLGMMPACRCQFTLDSIANVFANASAAILADPNTGTLAQPAIVVPTDFILTNITLCYKTVQFGSEVDDMVRGMNEKIFIKSSSFTNTGSVLPIASSGSIDTVFNTRLASIKSLFLHASSSSANKIFDSFEVAPNSEISFTIAGKQYPQRPLNRGNVLLELKQAIGSLMDKTNQSSINPLEFSRVLGTASTIIAPAKYFVAIDTQVISRNSNYGENSVLLSGVSTQSSPISVRMSIGTPTPVAANLNLICHYDAIIEIDTVTKQAYVRQ